MENGIIRVPQLFGCQRRNIFYTKEDDGNSNILSVSGSENVTYTYDSRNRLTSSQRNGTTITYTYDKRDNLLEEVYTKNEKTIKSIQYTYSGDNRLECKTEDGTTISYEYDLNGNLTGDSEGEPLPV